MTKGIIFSDVDGTLAHKDRSLDGLLQIEDEPRYVARETIEAIEEIREAGYKFVLITGRRKSGYERLTELIPHDFAIIEHGCVIIEGNNIDQEWMSQMKSVSDGTFWQYEQKLISEGYKTDSKGRLATFRVYIDKPGNLTEEQKRTIEERLHPNGIITTRNMAMLDLLPVEGGKANSIAYLLQEIQARTVFCMGDDVNDEDMLLSGHRSLTLSSANEGIIEIVRSSGGYVSPHKYHEGTIDMIKQILQS